MGCQYLVNNHFVICYFPRKWLKLRWTDVILRVFCHTDVLCVFALISPMRPRSRVIINRVVILMCTLISVVPSKKGVQLAQPLGAGGTAAADLVHHLRHDLPAYQDHRPPAPLVWRAVWFCDGAVQCLVHGKTSYSFIGPWSPSLITEPYQHHLIQPI